MRLGKLAVLALGMASVVGADEAEDAARRFTLAYVSYAPSSSVDLKVDARRTTPVGPYLVATALRTSLRGKEPEQVSLLIDVAVPAGHGRYVAAASAQQPTAQRRDPARLRGDDAAPDAVGLHGVQGARCAGRHCRPDPRRSCRWGSRSSTGTAGSGCPPPSPWTGSTSCWGPPGPWTVILARCAATCSAMRPSVGIRSTRRRRSRWWSSPTSSARPASTAWVTVKEVLAQAGWRRAPRHGQLPPHQQPPLGVCRGGGGRVRRPGLAGPLPAGQGGVLPASGLHDRGDREGWRPGLSEPAVPAWRSPSRTASCRMQWWIWCQRQIELAQRMGVVGTPTYFANGEIISAANKEWMIKRLQAIVAAKGVPENAADIQVDPMPPAAPPSSPAAGATPVGAAPPKGKAEKR